MNYKNLLSVLLFGILLSIQGYAQPSLPKSTKKGKVIGKALIECIYQYTTVSEPYQTEGEPTLTQKIAGRYQTILQTNATISKFFDYHTFQKDSVVYTANKELSSKELEDLNAQYNYKIRYFFEPMIFKNYPQGKMSVTDVLPPYDYLYEETQSGLNWELEPETLTVCGYQCNKAVTTYGGQTWTAWFTPEIAISDGPWKLYGLPGLILKAEESKGEHTFEAIGIRKSDHPIYFEEDHTRIKASKKDFLPQKIQFDAHREPLKNLQGSVRLIVAHRAAGMFLVDGKRIKSKKTSIDSPLELE